MTELVIDTPRKLLPALEAARYIALYGGRAGMKSHFFAEKLIERALMKRTRWACIREIQGTLRESVRQLLVDKIAKFKLETEFEVLDNEIRCPHDGLIIFKGMQSYNAANIKSLEDFDGAWVEEAQTFSATSLRMLRPTIRKDGSELWFSWNPRFETDAVDLFFRGKNPPDNAIIINVNWNDNPWFNDTLKKEKDQDYADDAEMAEHVWGGGYERITAGAYFAKHIARLEKLGRVSRLPYDPKLGLVYSSWDLGVDDYTVIWFFQIYAVDGIPRVRIIDYYEASGLGAEDIIKSAMPEYTMDLQDRVEAMVELGREQAFTYQRHFFPHDIGNREWGAGAKTRVQTVNALGMPLGKINRGVAQDPDERINAVRQLLPMCEFNQTERVMLGLSRLRRYSRKINEQLGIYMGPLHDENSHAADGFGEFAVNAGITMPREPEEVEPQPRPGQFKPPPVQKRSPTQIKL
jgi:phage terminase large subunit